MKCAQINAKQQQMVNIKKKKILGAFCFQRERPAEANTHPAEEPLLGGGVDRGHGGGVITGWRSEEE